MLRKMELFIFHGCACMCVCVVLVIDIILSRVLFILLGVVGGCVVLWCVIYKLRMRSR